MRVLVLSLLCWLASAFWLALTSGCNPNVDLGSVDLATPRSDGGTPADLAVPPQTDLAGGVDLAAPPLLFGPAGTYDLVDPIASVASGHLNGDSFPDLVVSSQSGNKVSVLLGTGKGTFNMPPM